MNKNEQDRLRELIYVVAAERGSNLEWIVELKDQFTVGEIQRDSEGYYSQVKDAFLEKESKVYISEDKLRKEEFTDDIERANNEFNYRIEEIKRKKEEKWSNRKRTARRFAISLATGLALLSASKFAITAYNKPERVKAREEARRLEERANFIETQAVYLANQVTRNIENPEWLVSEYEENYFLNEKDRVKVTTVRGNKDSEKQDKRLALILNGETRFISESWGFDSADNDARNLEYLQIKEGDKWVNIEEIPESRKTQYHDLILQIADMRKR